MTRLGPGRVKKGEDLVEFTMQWGKLIQGTCVRFSWEIDFDEQREGGGGSKDSGLDVINYATQWATVSPLKGEFQKI